MEGKIFYKNRKLNRLKNFDYSQNRFYFVTICTKSKINYFGEIKNQKMVLNEYGEIVKNCWLDLVNHYENCVLYEYIVMPNHVHGIINIINNVGNGLKPFPTGKNHELSEIIRGFKTFSSRKINEKMIYYNFQWQKSFYDKIIRNEKLLNDISKYIIDNPLNWHIDENENN